MRPPPKALAVLDPLPTLKSVFGFPAFRGVQADVVERVLTARRTLAVMPTGAGKSLCYQLPAAMLEGTCVVVSPLIALMHDQLRAAEAVGLRAATLTSADENRAESIARFKAGKLDLLYIAPERASQPGFRDLLGATRLSLFAIDEAHCVSEWGHDFRPDYRLLRPLLDAFGDVPRLALTATADAHTRGDILEQLGIPGDGLIISGFDRPNIRYAITQGAGAGTHIAGLIRRTPGAGIVYATSRDRTERLAATLAQTGRRTRFYHAGMEPGERRRAQAEFVESEDMVMCATIAFGMGIDKPDVRFVAHAGLPKSIEGYYQESGRAGRDGDPAVAHLFWTPGDFSLARSRLGEVPADRRAAEGTRVDALAGLVETPRCRRAVLLRHFGETPPEKCGNCDNCLSAPGIRNATETARKLLSAAYRTGQRFGLGHLEKVLTGSADEKVLRLGHEKLSVFGIADEADMQMLKNVGRALQTRGALVANEHGGLALGGDARAILRGEAAVDVVIEPQAETQSERRRRGREVVAAADDPLFEALRGKRRELAQAAGVPPYVVFHDSVLRDMAAARPSSRWELARLAGIGERKLDAYGDAFLQVIRDAG